VDEAFELAKQLTELNVRPETSEGRVVVLTSRRREDGVDYEEALDAEDFTRLGVDPSLGYVDEHPEGSDRGGYVPFVLCTATYALSGSDEKYNYRVYWDENANEWFPS
jgi:hypothetical protein